MFSGYFPLNHYTGFTFPQLLNVIEKLAEVHAIGSAMIMKNKDELLKQPLFQIPQCSVSFMQNFLNPLYRDFSR